MNTNPFILRPDCLCERPKLKAVLADIFPSEKLKVNLILNAYDESIVTELDRVDRIDNFLMSKFIRVLMNDYGISEDNARWSVEYWINSYGVEVLGKENCIIAQTPTQPKSNPQPVMRKQAPAVYTPAPSEIVEVLRLEDNDKLPKGIIRRIPEEEQRNGVTDLKFSVFKDYTSGRYTALKVIGEYTAKCTQYTIMYILVYNANNELIDASFDEKLSNDFSGKKTFTKYLQVPIDEYVSKVLIRFTPDPVFVE